MKFVSTRGGAEAVTAGQAIIRGLACDGGLYVPETFPQFGERLRELADMPYPELAFEILKPFLTDYSESELRFAVENAYSYPINFSEPSIAPLKKFDDLNLLNENVLLNKNAGKNHENKIFFLELFHGRTQAFKDIALSLLPHLMNAAIKRERPGMKTVILTATSGDTGKAALEAFADAENISVVVFYPEDGVSEMQKLQMATQKGSNTCVIGVRGNFDDAQNGVKKIFGDAELSKRLNENGAAFSSANSINVGRLLPQVVYYYYAYFLLAKQNETKIGEQVNFTVPTGNFGNILAGYYAMRTGLPVGKLICASNRNNVLYDFLRSGVYDARRRFESTISPSMDILISSNLERLLYHLCGDGALVARLADELKREGRYEINYEFPNFYAAFATEEETFAALSETFSKGYLADPHTAVGFHAMKKYRETSGDETPNVIIATASPFKFAADVLKSVSHDEKINAGDPFGAMERLAELSGVKIPAPLANLRGEAVKHDTVCEVGEMKATLINKMGWA